MTPKKLPKPRSGLVWFMWIISGFITEVITVLDGIPNNTLSHWVVYTITTHQWTYWALGLVFLVTLGHWFLRKWIWRPPVFVEEDKKEING